MIILGYVYSPRAGAPGGAYAIRPYTGTIIRAIGPPRDTVIRAIGPPGGAYSIRPYTGTRLNKPTGRKAPTNQQFTGASADAGEAGQVPGKLGWRP